ncbi:MAG TPA: YezD family protein [Allosphingosinicella sp.]|nr:YezD family protein [Allosphingosinicella sp.]
MPDPLPPRTKSCTQQTPIDAALATIREYLENVRFGSIALTIHDGRIVQLEVTEKKRLAT